MAETLGFSRQHFHMLINQGIFPPPVYHVATCRPMYVSELQERCYEVLRSGVGENGQPVVFNNTRRRRGQKGQAQKPSAKTRPTTDAQAQRLAEQLAYLGVRATVGQVRSELRGARQKGIGGEETELLRHLVRRLGGDPARFL